jgi:23S rRNA (uracil1939-C5)-methyltransferase
VGVSELTYQTKSASYRVSAGAFFQTNRFLTDELVDIVTSGRSGEVAIDLYAGVGLFSTGLACNFRHIVSVESSQTAAGDLKYNLPVHGKTVRATTQQYLGISSVRPDAVTRARVGAGRRSTSLGASRSAQSRDSETGLAGERDLPPPPRQPDLVVVDPPRSGLGEAAAGALARLDASRLTYVSCDPATLARDLVPLRAAGYRVEAVHLVDLFPQTYHIESVVHLVR